jgi:hypothetical protein
MNIIFKKKRTVAMFFAHRKKGKKKESFATNGC